MIALNDITLPDDLYWADEFGGWSPVARSDERSLTGALVRQTATAQGGRPITLSGGERYGWASRATVVALQALVDGPDEPMTLGLHGRSFSVQFAADNPLEAQPVLTFTAPVDDDIYYFTLRLIEVAP